VVDGAGKRTATWRLWLQKSQHGEEIYLACRELGGLIHTSFHPTGEWHTTFSPQAQQGLNHDDSQPEVRRKFDEWPRPEEAKPGITLAYKILTPWASVTVPFFEAKWDLIQITSAVIGKANEATVLIVRPGLELQIRNADLVDQLDLADGGRVVVVNSVIIVPNMETPATASARYFRGKSQEDLAGENLRAMMIANDHNVHRMIIDAPLAPMKDDNQI
jgi:hypothetical protein